MKTAIIILIFLATLLSVNAVSVGLTNDEAFFEPGKPITFGFNIKNTLGKETTLSIEKYFGQLEEYSSSLPLSVTLKSSERANFQFTITPPNDLPYGAFPLNIVVKETEGTARSGSAVVFTIINMAPSGKPYLTFRVDESKNGQVPLILTVRNIGQTPLEAKPTFSVNDGQKESSVTTEPKIIPSLEKQIFYANLANITPGELIFFAQVNDETTNMTVSIGSVNVTAPNNITIPQKVTTEITLPITLNWNKPITTNLTWSVFRQGRGKIVQEEQLVTLLPGENQITYKAAIRSTASGTYPSVLSSSYPVIDYKFNVSVDSKMKPTVILEDDPELTDETEETQTTKVIKKDNNKIAVLLAAGAGLLLLAAGVRRARKHENA